MGIKVGVGGVVREVGAQKVGVSGVVRTVNEGFCGVSGVVRKFLGSAPTPPPFPQNFSCTVTLKGTYKYGPFETEYYCQYTGSAGGYSTDTFQLPIPGEYAYVEEVVFSDMPAGIFDKASYLIVGNGDWIPAASQTQSSVTFPVNFSATIETVTLYLIIIE